MSNPCWHGRSPCTSYVRFQAGQHPGYQPSKSDGFDNDWCCSPNTVSKNSKFLPALATQVALQEDPAPAAPFFILPPSAASSSARLCTPVLVSRLLSSQDSQTEAMAGCCQHPNFRRKRSRRSSCLFCIAHLFSPFRSVKGFFSQLSVTTDMFRGNLLSSTFSIVCSHLMCCWCVTISFCTNLSSIFPFS